MSVKKIILAPGPKDIKLPLKKIVDDEYKTWSSMSNEHDIVQHFSNSSNTVFLCVIWKMLLDTDTISPVAFKVLKKFSRVDQSISFCRLRC
jgi:mediator of RNA polymerase II transcription subunit 23